VIMHGIDIIVRLNREAVEGRPAPNPLRHHPRIHELRTIVRRWPVDPNYRAWLFRSLEKYADQLVTIGPDRKDGQWDDLEALQQVALGDMMECCYRVHWEKT
jgi:hypothetical protein